jgi:hypothetical protein
MDLGSLVTTVSPSSVNGRRTIWEPVNIIDVDGQPPALRVQAFEFYESPTSGANHYHRLNIETFFVISGTMTKLVLEDVRTRKRAIFTDLGPGTRIVVPPYIAHANTFAAGTIMVAACTAAREEGVEDDYPYRLLDENGEEVAQA